MSEAGEDLVAEFAVEGGGGEGAAEGWRGAGEGDVAVLEEDLFEDFGGEEL